MDAKNMFIGESVVLKGQLSASEDVTILGRVEGTIEMRDHVLTIGHSANVSAETTARTVLVAGSVTGNIVATEKVEIRENGSVEGDITAPKVAMLEGASFRGRVDMQRAKPTPKPTADATRLAVAI
jgi:cytoskeletal protein CcmA (bactofilin family)